MMNQFSCWPHYAEDEINAVSNILASGKVNYWTGDEGKLFEKEFAEYIGVNHCIAVMNGTVALEAALMALNIGPGDEVIVPCRTFIATASAVVKVGAKPVMADVNIDSQNITVETVQAVMTANTKAIIVVHLAGWPCDMASLSTFAKQHNIKLVEDCAQAIGATFNNKQVGAWGDVAAFSFCQDKIMSTGGEGGMIATNDAEIWQKIWAFKDHGKNYDAVYRKEHAPGFRWLHESFGTNLRMTEMQAGIGRLQLQKLNHWIELRRRNAAILSDAFSKIASLRTAIPDSHIRHVYYMYYVFIRPEALKPDWSRDRIMATLNAANVSCRVGSCSEIYLEQAFKTTDLTLSARLPVAQELGETSLVFLVHPTLTVEDMNVIAAAVKNVLSNATK